MEGNEDKKLLENFFVEIITVSDSKAASLRVGRDEDESGKTIQQKLEEFGISFSRTVIPDEADMIREKFEKVLSDPNVDMVVTTGGTGITSRDRTVDVAREFFEKELPGFGELMRSRSKKEIGAAAILSRVSAGLFDRKLIFCLPGSPNSVELGMDIILSDLEKIIDYTHE